MLISLSLYCKILNAFNLNMHRKLISYCCCLPFRILHKHFANRLVSWSNKVSHFVQVKCRKLGIFLLTLFISITNFLSPLSLDIFFFRFLPWMPSWLLRTAVCGTGIKTTWVWHVHVHTKGRRKLQSNTWK